MIEASAAKESVSRFQLRTTSGLVSGRLFCQESLLRVERLLRLAPW